MQHVLILNRLIPEQDGAGRICAINAVTHDGRSVRFESAAQQRVNLTTLEFQLPPLLLLLDQLQELQPGMLSVPSSALIAIVPLDAEEIRTLLGEGKGDALLRATSEQLL